MPGDELQIQVGAPLETQPPAMTKERWDLETDGLVTILGPEEEKAREGVEKAYAAYAEACKRNGWTVPPVDLVVRRINIGTGESGGVRPYETRVMVLPASENEKVVGQLKQIAAEVKAIMDGIRVITPLRIEFRHG